MATIANSAFLLAVLWHAIVAAVFFVVALGWHPSRRTVTLLSCAPLVSVSLVAWMYGNPFNGSVFGLLAMTLALLSTRVPSARLSRPPPWATVLGAAMMAFAWVYPHFLDPQQSRLAYLYGAPLGLLPCPTLSFVIGVALVAGAPSGRAATLVVGTAGAYYGLIGTVQLGVWIDLVLLVGALGLLVLSIRGSTAASLTSHHGGTRLA